MKQLKCLKCSKIWYVDDVELNSVNTCPFCSSPIRCKGTIGNIDFAIKNIGLGSARNVKINIESNIMNEMIEKKYCILEKDKIENLSFVGSFVINEDYHFKVKVSYQDLLLNYYEQEIDFSYKLTPYTNNSDRKYIISDLIIKEEKFINNMKKEDIYG